MTPTTELTVTQSVSTGHRLKDYVGLCSSLHGHNLRVVVHVLTSSAFLDFKKVSDILQKALLPLDHAMVLEREDPLIVVLRPFSLRLVVLSVAPTTEALATLIFNEMSAQYLHVGRVTVHETERYSATALFADPSVFVVEGGA